MRISNISDYLGGASNVVARSLIRGEQIHFNGIVTESDGTTPIDIADWTVSSVVEFYKGDATVGRSGATITNLVAFEKDDTTLTFTKAADTSTGVVTLTVPADLVSDDDTAELDASTGIIMPVAYLTFNSGGTNPTIRKSRAVFIIRHSG